MIEQRQKYDLRDPKTINRQIRHTHPEKTVERKKERKEEEIYGWKVYIYI